MELEEELWLYPENNVEPLQGFRCQRMAGQELGML